MKVLHLISGAETGGSKKHILTLLSAFEKGEVILGVFEWGPFAEEAVALGIDVEHFLQKSRYDFSVQKGVLSLIETKGCTVLHSHGPRANLLVAIMKKKLTVPWVVTVHSNPLLDFMNEGIKGKVFTTLHVWALKKVDACFAVTPRFRDDLVKIGMDEEKITVVYNGIDFTEPVAKRGVKRSDLGLDEGSFVAVMVARMHAVKDHPTLLRAFKAVKASQDRLVLVGDGPDREKVERLVTDLGLRDAVIVLGQRSDAEQIMGLSDVVLLTSVSESFPLVLLEAAKAGRPVIATDVGGVKALIEPGKTGWIFEPGDEAGLRQALTDAKASKERLPEMGSALHEHAKEHFSLEQLYEDTKKLYKAVKKD